MDKPCHHYYGLCVLDVLDHETVRTAKGSPELAKELRVRTYTMMSYDEMDEYGVYFHGYMRRVSDYFGPGEGGRLFEMVKTLYGVASAHVLQRVTGESFTFHPEEFESLMAQNE